MSQARDERGRFIRARPIRSDPVNVKRQDEWLKQRERRSPDLAPMRARRYRPGVHSHTAGHPASGGLPSLGKGY